MEERTTMKKQTVSRANRTGVAVLALAVLSTGCTAMRTAPTAQPESELPAAYSGLQNKPDFPAALVYLKPDVQWGQYSAIMLESAGLHVTDKAIALSPEGQTTVAGMLSKAMTEELGKYFDLATTPAPNALRVATQWIQVPDATVLWVTTIPQLRMATAVRDSVSGERLIAAVDAHAETQAAFSWSASDGWSGVQPWIDYWSKRCAWQLWRLGVRLKPGATPPEEPEKPALLASLPPSAQRVTP